NRPATSSTSQEAPIVTLYRQLLKSWNDHDAGAFAALFDNDGISIGFDGSSMHGCGEIERGIGQIFTDHVTAAYLRKRRTARSLTPELARLPAAAGVVPPGKSDTNPAVNTIQTLVAVKREDQWHIAQFQNTPAQSHGRPELSDAPTEELPQLI